MPNFYNNSSPIFTILATFLMCGAVIGSFSSVYVPSLNTLGVDYEIYPKSILTCLFDALKYNLILLIFSRFLGFLMPIYVLVRGYLLSFSISVVYANSGGFFDKSLLYESVFHNFFAVPCFLIIATSCFDIYISQKKTNARNFRKNRALKTHYRIIFILITLNLAWNFLCMSIF